MKPPASGKTDKTDPAFPVRCRKAGPVPKAERSDVNQKISDARFAKRFQRYEQEQGENAKRIKDLRLS